MTRKDSIGQYLRLAGILARALNHLPRGGVSLNVRLLRGLTGKALSCGCLVGTYETYDGRVVTIVDARGDACSDATHRVRAVMVGALEPTLVQVKEARAQVRRGL